MQIVEVKYLDNYVNCKSKVYAFQMSPHTDKLSFVLQGREKCHILKHLRPFPKLYHDHYISAQPHHHIGVSANLITANLNQSSLRHFAIPLIYTYALLELTGS